MTNDFDSLVGARHPRPRIAHLAAALTITALVVMLPAARAGASTSTGLVAAYGFEEGSGTTVVDSSGNGNTGSLVGATRASGGEFGQALSFDGENARVVVPDSQSLRLSDAMTLEAWVKPAALTNAWRDVIYKGDDNYYLEATSDRDSKPAGAASFDSTPEHVFAPSRLPVGSWTHLAVTYDGTALRLYVNGDEVAEAPRSGTIASSTNPLELGGDSIYGQYFDGLIDEVRIYNVALTAAEIQSDMSKPIAVGAPGGDAPPSAPGTPGGPTDTGAGPGPLHVDQSGRYLVDQSGRPFLMTGDSPQALISDLTESDAALFFSTRRAQGFNTVWINLLCDDYTGCRQDGETWDGIAPFSSPGDVSTPNEAYFARADRMIQLAARYGLIVILDPADTGGWVNTLVASGVEKDRAYGQYLGRRYGGYSNIVWMSGNDYNWSAADDPYVIAVAQGIRDSDPSALQTVEFNELGSPVGSLDDPAWAPLIDLNGSYTYDPAYGQVLKDYNRGDFLPTFLAEAYYEGEHNSTPQSLRAQEYWALLSGAMGQLFGERTTWQFLCSQRDADGNCVGGWKDQLDSPGAAQMANVVSLFSSRRWYQLVPDQDHRVLTSGYGSFGGYDYVTAASTPDGKLAIAYVPSARTVTVDLSALSGPVTARWYDPTNGTFTAIGDGSLANDGSVSLTTPGANAEGAEDWVLVLEAP